MTACCVRSVRLGNFAPEQPPRNLPEIVLLVITAQVVRILRLHLGMEEMFVQQDLSVRPAQGRQCRVQEGRTARKELALGARAQQQWSVNRACHRFNAPRVTTVHTVLLLLYLARLDTIALLGLQPPCFVLQDTETRLLVVELTTGALCLKHAPSVNPANTVSTHTGPCASIALLDFSVTNPVLSFELICPGRCPQL